MLTSLTHVVLGHDNNHLLALVTEVFAVLDTLVHAVLLRGGGWWMVGKEIEEVGEEVPEGGASIEGLANVLMYGYSQHQQYQ